MKRGVLTRIGEISLCINDLYSDYYHYDDYAAGADDDDEDYYY